MTPAEELARYLGARTFELDAKKLVPMLCEREEAAERVLGRPGWLFELKLDGVRIVAEKRLDGVRLFYRKGRDATESYAEVAKALEALEDEHVVLDGEIVAFDEQGKPDFQRLGHRIQTDMKRSARSPVFVPVVYVVFDVLAIGPYDLRGFPLEARKEILSRVIPSEGLANGIVRPHPTFDNGVALFDLCREHRLEGVVAKKLGSSYRDNERSTDWLKIKCELDAEFVVIGWTEGESDRARLGALDLGAYEGDRLVFRGRVGSGLHGEIIDRLLERLLPIEVAHPVAQGKYSPKPKRHHCHPEIVVSVRYGGFSLDPSGARFLRFPVFRGIRPDVHPKDCTAAPEDDISERAAARPRPRAGERPRVVESRRTLRRIHVTAPSQSLLPDGTTKDVLCKYFEALCPAILRHARGRACSLRRPDGTALWPPPKWMPKFVQMTSSKVGSREIRGFLIDSVDTLLFAVEAVSPSIQHGPFLDDRPDQSDFVALRVTAPGTAERVATARAVQAVADEIGLPAAAKSSGPRSLDVLIGLGAAPAAFAGALGELVARLASESFDAKAAKIEVVDSVPLAFTPVVDPASGSVVVAVPLAWDELDDVDIAAVDFDAARRVARASAPDDPLDAILNPRVTVDVAAATVAIERAIAARALR
jgi:bifunctional non-homologous end joining protein LigD